MSYLDAECEREEVQQLDINENCAETCKKAP